MSAGLSAAELRFLFNHGLSPDAVIEYAELRESMATVEAPSEPMSAYERKKAYDAERMRVKREEARQSYDSRTTSYDTPSPEVLEGFPLHPLPKTPTPILSPSPPKGGSVPSGDDFAVFWKAYPRKAGKADAERAWRKAKGRPPLAKILAAIELYVANKNPDIDYCHPATWLNRGRWDDEWSSPPTTRQIPEWAREQPEV